MVEIAASDSERNVIFECCFMCSPARLCQIHADKIISIEIFYLKYYHAACPEKACQGVKSFHPSAGFARNDGINWHGALTIILPAGAFMKRDVKALIVDDSKSFLITMEKMLKKQGILDITKAVNGLKAAKCFEEALRSGTPYSVVFLDIIMPVMDGQEALKLMRAMEKAAGTTKDDKAIIIMISSLHSPSDMIHALIYGDSTDFLVKPLDIKDLLGMLAKYDCLPDAGSPSGGVVA